MKKSSKKIAIEIEQFWEENFNDLNPILSKQCQVDYASLLDIINSDQSMSESSGSEVSSLMEGSFEHQWKKEKKSEKKYK